MPRDASGAERVREGIDAAEEIKPGKAGGKKRRKPSQPGRGVPIVKLYGGSLPHSIDQAELILVERDLHLYQRGDAVVRPALDSITVTGGKKVQGLRAVRMKPLHLADRLTRIVDFQKFDARSEDWVSVDCPPHLAAAYCERIGAWRLRPLRGIATAPTLRPDGSILAEPGYDPETGLLLAFAETYPAIPERPSRQEGRAALDVLLEPLSAFPFVGPNGADATGKPSPSRSVALSAQLTSTVRRSLERAPLHGFTANAAGSGKSLLCDHVAMIAMGHEAPAFSQGRTEEETEKRLVGALLHGDALINIDNCTVRSSWPPGQPRRARPGRDQQPSTWEVARPQCRPDCCRTADRKGACCRAWGRRAVAHRLYSGLARAAARWWGWWRWWGCFIPTRRTVRTKIDSLYKGGKTTPPTPPTPPSPPSSDALAEPPAPTDSASGRWRARI
jgi:hypothetical protein